MRLVMGVQHAVILLSVAWIASRKYRLQVIHELHTAIDKAFRTAGIAIAFPQRDLHIRSTLEALAQLAEESRTQDIRPNEAA